MTDSPPPYEHATQSGSSHKPPVQDKAPPPEPAPPAMQAGPAYAVYHYVNPGTGERLTTPFPPNHPEMICLQQGSHVRRTKFGLLGVLAAVFWFPLGIGLCLLDRRVTCDRCGRTIEDSVICG